MSARTDGGPWPTVQLELVPSHRRVVRQPRPPTLADRARSYLVAHPTCTFGELSRELGITPIAAVRLLHGEGS